jgi:hypothetical protein
LVIAVDGGAGRATAVLAQVAQGARVAVVAGQGRLLKGATGLGETAVDRALVFVITDHARAQTRALGAGVRLGAGVLVITVDPIEVQVLASTLSCADVFGAVVRIITAALVDLSVAVVVDAVTDLLAGLGRVTGLKTVRSAASETLTGAPFVGDRARGGERQVGARL